jgi:AcrR family transcriptional regulator
VKEGPVASEAPGLQVAAGTHGHAGRRDAVRNYHRVLDAAREVLGESGADASMEEIAARAGVGVGTVYRRFANKEALIDELLRLSLAEALDVARHALAGPAGAGLEEFLWGLGAVFAKHARFAQLLIERSPDAATTREFRAAVQELTARAVAAGTVNPGVAFGDVMALIWAMNGLTRTTVGVSPDTWQRFLDINLAGLRSPGPLSPRPPISASEVAQLPPRA